MFNPARLNLRHTEVLSNSLCYENDKPFTLGVLRVLNERSEWAVKEPFFSVTLWAL